MDKKTLRLFYKYICPLTLALSLVFIIVGGMGFYLAADVLYAAFSVLYSLLLIICGLVICLGRSTRLLWRCILPLSMIPVISISNNPVIIFSAAFLLGASLLTIIKKRRTSMIMLCVVVIIAVFNISGAQLVISSDGPRMTYPSEKIYCDVSPKGTSVLYRTERRYGRMGEARYYIIRSMGFFRRELFVTSTGIENNVHYFNTENTTTIGNSLYTLN